MRSLVVILYTIVVVNGASIEEEWKFFKENQGKQYRNILEENKRFQIFKESVLEIEEHNKRYKLGEVSYELVINKFADMTEEEFRARLNPQPVEIGGSTVVGDVEDSDIPEEFDWREKGAITGVKDQGDCGSCWAFGTMGALEAQYFLKTGKLISFSEQFLVDCSMENHGCAGGLTKYALKFVREWGVVTEESYPNEHCNVTTGTLLKDIGYVNLPRNENAMKTAVAKVGPVIVSIDSVHLRLYGGGVFDDDLCSKDSTDHVVLITGYGVTEDGIDYWIVKNSWGADWGEEGYVKIARNKNQCAINLKAYYPIIL